MHNHAPKNYICPICVALEGKENEHTLIRQSDIFYRTKNITALMNSRRWPNNTGNILVVPNEHFENIYDMPEDILSEIHLFAKRVALALKEIYQCDGTTIRQHNEPAGNQDAFHFHVHVMPRYTNDNLYLLNDEKSWTTPDERKPYAKKLREFFKT